MGRIEKTVFISYRRTNIPWALAIFQNLTQFGYDVFFDFSGLASGDFENVILENIYARAHFLVLLTPSALERCNEAGDWLRREIEAALDSKRNIVPLMLEGFDFGTPAIADQLTGKLAKIKQYNALSIPPEYFLEAMGRLRDRYLNVALDAVLHPASRSAVLAAKEEKGAAAMAPAVVEEELTAQQWFERGLDAAGLSEKVRLYSQAIRLKPDYAKAFNNRGYARRAQGDLEGALQDYDQAIRLDPAFALAFNNRGNVRRVQGDLPGALKDYGEAIRLKADYALAFYNRGVVRYAQGDLESALQDYSEAIRLKPDDALAFNNRGNTRRDRGDLEGALQDFDEALRLRPDLAEVFDSRGSARRDKGDLEGALQDFSEAMRLKPDFADALKNRDAVLKAIADRSRP
jgi:tetratricopeptide (TPR) repeat protein